MIVPVVTILYGALYGTAPYPFTLVSIFLVVFCDDQKSYGIAGRRGYSTRPSHGVLELYVYRSNHASASNCKSLYDGYRELSCHVAG
jgi:hypothetical protein